MTTNLVDRLAGVSEGLAQKAPVRAATTADIALSGLQTIDTIAVVEGDRVLVKDQADATQNGIWNASSGNWTRAVDFDGARDAVMGTRVYVNEGAPLMGGGNGQTEWAITTADPIVFGTSDIEFTLLGWLLTSQAVVGAAIAIKMPCKVATTANIALSGLQIINGYQTVSGDRVLVWQQTLHSQNGIYTALSGAWLRAADFATTGQVVDGTLVPVVPGSTNTGVFQLYSPDPIAIGTSSILFRPYSSGSVYSAPAFGWLCDGMDHSTQALALLAIVSMAGGGTISFPANPALNVSSGTYNSSTGVVTLTMAQSVPFSVGASVNACLIGTGSIVAQVTGTVLSAADTIGIKFSDPSVIGLPLTVTYTLGAGETTTSIATGLKNLINANSTLAGLGIAATASTSNITITGIKNSTQETSIATGTGNEVVLFGANTFVQVNFIRTTTAPTGATTVSFQATAALGPITITGGALIPTYRADSQLLIPNDNANWPSQKNIRLTGAGGGQNWYAGPARYAPSVPSASVLDLRFQNGDGQSAKIETRGVGALQIDNLQIMDGGASNTNPLLHTTNTVLTIHDNTFIASGNVAQDAIVLGGTSSNIDGSLNAGFQGYGTNISRNVFLNGNRGVYGLTYCNSVIVNENTFPFQGNTGTHAIEFDGSHATHAGAQGIICERNLIEMDTYQCGIALTVVSNSIFSGNSFWDPGSGQLGNYCLLGNGNGGNIFISAESDVAGAGVNFYDPFNFNRNGQLLLGGWGGFDASQFPQGGNTASFNIAPGTPNPTRKRDGDVWYDGSNTYFRRGSLSTWFALLGPTTTVATALPQATGGSTLLALPNAAGVSVGQSVQAANVPVGATVASLVSTNAGTESTNGTAASGQKVIPFANPLGFFAVGQQCTDTTTPTAIGAGNVIASIQNGVSITMTANLAANIGSGDSITCYPVVTLSAPTSAAIAAAAPINFYTNHTSLSASSTFYNPGDASISGNLIVGGASYFGTPSSQTGTLNLANAASAFLTTIQAGNAAAARTYTWPTNFGSAGYVLTDAAGNGTLSWAPGGSGLTVGTSAITSGASTRILYDNAGVLGEYTITGSGTVVAMQTSPVFVTPALGTPASAVLTNATGLPVATGISGLGTGIATALAVNAGSAGAPVLFNGAGGTPSSLTGTNITGTASGLTAGNVTTNANLTGDVTSVGNATTLTNAPVIAKVLTGYVSGAGTVSAADSILSAFQKINGNDALKAPLASPTFTGTAAHAIITATGAITDTQSIAAVSTDGLVLTNTTAAANNAQQWSPRIHLTGQGWKTTATAASQATDWIIENQPQQGTANPTSNLVISSQINAAGYSAVFTVNSTTGNVTNNGGFTAGAVLGGAFFTAAGGQFVLSTANGLGLGTAMPVSWGSSAGWASADTWVFRLGAGNIQISTSATPNSSGSISLATINIGGIIYSAAGTPLPTCNSGSKGTHATVSDATGPTYLATYTSGGAVIAPVFCNGTNWLTG